jgi:RHS repeat-associated protein
LLIVTDALGRSTTYTYDALNRLTSSKDALGQTTANTYDAVGNMLSASDELGQATTYTYDRLNRRTKVTDALGHNQTTVYDSVGNVLSIADGLNNITTYGYDAKNRRVSTIDAKGGITSTNYDAIGNVTKITDSVGNATSYTYDRLDRMLTETNQLGFSRSHGYDAVGNQIEMIDRNGRKKTYAYDAVNRQTSENWIGANGRSVRSTTYTYDAVDNLITAIDPDSTYTYGYDAVDRVTSIDNTGTTGVPAVILAYSYDAVGNVIGVSDKINGTNAGNTNYIYDLLDRATRITQSGTGVSNKRVEIAYNAVSQMTRLTRFGDLAGTQLVAETTYGYDNKQRLIQLAHKRGNTSLASYDYVYDGGDRLTQIISSTDGTVNYAYDATNQLTGADHSSQTDEAYQYDANGNRTNAGYQTGTNNQLLSDGQFTYEYDQEGNRTKRIETATGKVTEYVWDYRNRLAGVLFKDAGGNVLKSIGYTYDSNNQRIGKSIDGVVVERYVIDRDQIGLVFDRQGNQTHRYLYGTGIDQVLADETPNGVTWALADHQGTVKDLLDGNGAIVSHITYDSFGRVISNTGNIDFRYGYTGREADAETGLDYYRARYYDAAVGGFISEDPIGFAADDTNLRRYVGNNPTNWNDPSGLDRSETIDTGWGPIEIVVGGTIIVLGTLGKAIGDGFNNIANGLQEFNNSFPKTRGEDLSQPILSFPDPNRDRFGLGGSPGGRTGSPGAVPHGTPGFDLDSPFPPIINTGHPRSEDLSLPYLNADHFITTPNGVTLPPNQDFNLVPTNPGDKWLQIHGTHDHAGIDPHTHYPEVHIGPSGRGKTNRMYNPTTADDIERANEALELGEMRHRNGKQDKGGTP